MKTFNDGLAAAVDLLSRHFFSYSGECSAAKLHPCSAPSLTNRLYIAELDRLEREGGDYEDGVLAAIDVLSKYGARRGPKGPHLVSVKNPDQHMSLYISRLQSLLNGGA